MKFIRRKRGAWLGLCLVCLVLLLAACTPGQGTEDGTGQAGEETTVPGTEAASDAPTAAETVPDSPDETTPGAETQPSGDCNHAFGDWVVAEEASCTGNGLRKRTCTLCGVVEEDVIPAVGHTEVEDPAVAPTCTEDGRTSGTHCSVCGEVVKASEIIYTFGHTPVTDAAVEPTCAQAGLTVGTHCSVCGEVIIAQQTIDRLAHTPAYDNAVEPTCQASGLTDGVHCSVCGEVIKAQEVVPAKEHISYVEAGTPSTCTEEGITDSTICAVCGEVLSAHEPIPAKGHTPGPASCTQDQVCTECGTVVAGPLGHESADRAAVEPTCTEAGCAAGTVCARCGEVLSGCEVLPALGHKFAADASCTENQVCLVCGQTLAAVGEHIEVVDAGYEPTCTKDGLTDGTHCAVCGKVIVAQKVIPALSHDVVKDAAVAATCQTPGLTAGSHCARCGEILEKQEKLPTTAHVKKLVGYLAPTCTEPGRKVGNVCAYCGVVMSGCEVIPPLGHTPVVLDAVPATCVRAGRMERIVCDVCRKILVYGTSIKPLGHHMENVDRVEPTCTKIGYEAGRMCTVCGYEEVIRLIIPATGHTPVTDEAVEPTAATHGLSAGSHCSVCGEVLEKQRILAMTGTELHPGDASAFRGIVISKVFGTGKSNTDASASHGFIELYNYGDADVSLSGLSLYLRKDADDEFKEFTFPQDAVIPAGGYWLIRAKSPEGYDPAAAVITVESCDAEWDTYIDNKECSLVLAPSGWTLFPGEDVTELTDAVSVFAASATVESDSVWFTDDMSKKKVIVRNAMTNYSGYHDVNLLKANTSTLQAIAPRTSDGRVNPVKGTLNEVYFSHPAGMYTEAFDLSLTAAEGYTIRYTLDGTDPRTSSTAKRYVGPLTLADSSAMPWGPTIIALKYSSTPRDELMPGGYVVKAYATDGTTQTPVYTNTYFVSQTIADWDVQVMSISLPAADVTTFYQKYYNSTVEDKRPRAVGVLETFDRSGSRTGCSVVEMAVNGKTTVSLPQKSLRLYYKGSNNEEGGLESDLYTDLFEGRALDAKGQAITDFSRFLIRNSGQDGVKADIRDAYMQRVSADLRIETMASSTVVVFINGELWGVYNARERYSPEYFESHYGVDKDNVVILDNDYAQINTNPRAPLLLSTGIPGDEEDFNRLYEFITTHDMTDEALLRYVEAHLDTDSLVDLFAARIFFNAKDWPENNIRVWRNKNPDDPSGMDTRWHFTLLDMDWGMSYLTTSTEDTSYFYVAMKGACVVSDIIRSLMTNNGFRERVLVRFYRVFTEVYDTDTLTAELQAMYDERKPLMELNAMRWPGSLHLTFTMEIWEKEMAAMFKFVERRQALCLAQFYSYFGLNNVLMKEMIERVEGTAA